MLHGYNDSLVRNVTHTKVNAEGLDILKVLFKKAHAFNVSCVSNIIRKNSINTTNLLPPFPLFWIEGAAEPNLVDDVGYLCGTLVSACKEKDGYRFECYSFMQSPRIGVVGPVSMAVFRSDGSGNIEKGTIDKEDDGYVSQYQSYVPTGNAEGDAKCDCITVANFLGLINAKNVSCPSRVFEVNNYNKRILNKKKANRYHVLKIHKPGEKIRKESTGENEGKMPLHVVRGHLADYTENGLFGKYFGTYFIPSHVRGDVKNGTVTKDYALV